MGSPILALAQQAMPEMNLASPTSIFGSGIQDNLTVAALFNAAGYELSREFDWNELITELRFYMTFTTQNGTVTNGSTTISGLASTAGFAAKTYTVTGTGLPNDTVIVSVGANSVVVSQPFVGASGTYSYNFCQTQYPIASDYDRQINRTQWDKTKHWEMLGPESQQQWQWLKSGFISTGPRLRWTMQGGYFNIWPPTPTAEYLGLSYISKNWALAGGTTPAGSFTADTDTCIFPDRLMVTAVKKKYFALKGFDASDMNRDYQMHLSIAKAANLGASNLSFAPTPSQVLISIAQIPDTGYGS